MLYTLFYSAVLIYCNLRWWIKVLLLCEKKELKVLTPTANVLSIGTRSQYRSEKKLYILVSVEAVYCHSKERFHIFSLSQNNFFILFLLLFLWEWPPWDSGPGAMAPMNKISTACCSSIIQRLPWSTPPDKLNWYLHHKSTITGNFIWNTANASFGSWKFITI